VTQEGSWEVVGKPISRREWKRGRKNTESIDGGSDAEPASTEGASAQRRISTDGKGPTLNMSDCKCTA
jgi:hypothetical protein